MRHGRLIALILTAAFMLASCGKVPAEETTLAPATTSVAREAVETRPSPTVTPVVYTPDIPENEQYKDLQYGMTFTYGTYEGEPIEWIVLSRTRNMCIVVARDNVTNMAFAEDGTFTSWADSDIRVWLNTEFYTNSFTDEERARIKSAPDYTNPVIPEEDMIFLLGRSEVGEYETRFELNEASSDWWLRSYAPAGTYERADYCSTTGELDIEGISITEELGVRPAMRFYCGSEMSCLEPVPAYCTPFPTPSPTPEPTEVPEATPTPASSNHHSEDCSLPEVVPAADPGSMTIDGSSSDEAALERYYEDYVLDTFGQSPLGCDDYEILMSDTDFLDVEGAVTYVIDDFDGDGDDEMIVPVFVEENSEDFSPYERMAYSSTYFYRLHLLLCEIEDGEVRVTYDYAMMIFTGDDEVSGGYCYGDVCLDGFESTCLCGRTIRIYTIDRGDQVNILVHTDSGFSSFGDGYIASAYELSIDEGEMQYESAYVMPGMGSADFVAYQYYFEDGEITYREAYYEDPVGNGADEDMVFGIDLYFDRIGLDNEMVNLNDVNGCYQITDSDATLVAGISFVPSANGIGGTVDDPHPYQYWVEHIN